MKFLGFIKTHQTKIVLIIGYILVGSLSFWLGHNLIDSEPVVITQSETFNPPLNYTPNVAAVQTVQCDGKIKGSSSHIYHIPGGAFYDKTAHPVACFNTEAQAVAAGFRKSAR
jgi:hypothetical protein